MPFDGWSGMSSSRAHLSLTAPLSLLSQVNPRSSALAQRARKHFTTAYLYSRAETIYAGTTEVQLDIIAQRIMDLPKDL